MFGESPDKEGKGKVKTLKFRDDFTIRQVSEICAAVREAMNEWDELIIDLMEVTRMDVTALQVLLAAQNQCGRTGRRLHIRKPDSLMDFLSLLGNPL